MSEKKTIKRLIGIIPALFCGFLSINYFFQTDPQILTGYSVSADILKRRLFLVDYLERHPFPEEKVGIEDPEFKGRQTLETYAYASFALTNIAMLSPETSLQAASVIATWIDRCFKEQVYHFDKSIWNESPTAGKTINDDRGHLGYYAYLNFMLGCHSLLSNSDAYTDFHVVLTESIARRLEKYPHHHAESLVRQILPVDNAVAVASLKLADLSLGTDHSELISSWLDEVRRLKSESPDGLLPSSIEFESGKGEKFFRGSMMGRQILFLSLIDSKYALELFRQYQKKAEWKFLSFYAFRETLGGNNSFEKKKGEFFGLGLKATAFALAGARWEQDETLARGLMRSIELGGITLSKQNMSRFVMYSVLDEAEILAARTTAEFKPLWRE